MGEITPGLGAHVKAAPLQSPGPPGFWILTPGSYSELLNSLNSCPSEFLVDRHPEIATWGKGY
jgi:hypothetical protein